MLRLICISLSVSIGAAVGIAACGTEATEESEAAALSNDGFSEILSIGSLGTEPGDQGPVFSEIQDVRSSPDGSFLVLDRLPSVRWFDQSGTYQGSVSSSGSGPGELREPTNIVPMCHFQPGFPRSSNDHSPPLLRLPWINSS